VALRSRKPVILVVNKMDKAKGAEVNHFNKVGINDYVLISVTQGKGIGELLDKIIDVLPNLTIRKQKRMA